MYKLTYRIMSEQGAAFENTVILCAKHLRETVHIITHNPTWNDGTRMFAGWGPAMFQPFGECQACSEIQREKELHPCE